MLKTQHLGYPMTVSDSASSSTLDLARRLARAAMVRVSDTAARGQAQSEVAALGAAIRDAAAQRQAQIAVSGNDPACAAVVNGLLPRRIGAAQMAFLWLSREDALDLREFAAVTRDVAEGSIAAARSADEICEAVGDALDSLHSFLLTHRLVPETYLDDTDGDRSVRGGSGGPSDEEVWDRLAHEPADGDPIAGADVASDRSLVLAA